MQTDSRKTAEDPRKAAEEFIEKVVAPARATRPSDQEAARARTELAREELELAKRQLVDGGLDPGRLDKLAADRSKSRKKLAEEGRRRAIAGSAAAAGRLADLAVQILPMEPLESVIDQVTFIRSFAGQGAVHDSNVGPSDNWAKYRVQSSGNTWDGTGRLSFFTLWRNQLNTPTMIFARPNLVINAHLSCDAEWSGVAAWFGMDSQGRGVVRARTTVWSMDSSVSSIVHDRIIESVMVSGGFFGDEASKSIEFSELLPASGVTVPPQSYVLIEVELLTEWHVESSTIVLDAESGSHRVDVPHILLTEIRPPAPAPISLTAGVDYATSPARVTLIFTGANGAMVDIYQNGVRLGDTENDGVWSNSVNPGTHTFRVCERLSSVCSTDVSVTVTQ